MSGRRVIVLGALSAVAEAVCRELAADGAKIAMLARNDMRMQSVAQDLRVRGAANVTTHALDLAAPADSAATLSTCARELGGVDAVLVFYGVLGSHSVAEADLVEAQRILNVNFNSAASWLLQAANMLEAQGQGGALVAISSVAGDRGRRSNYVYGAAKGALSILIQGLAHRFGAKPNGPRAVVVKLGFVDTPMTADVKKGGPLWATPEGVAPAIVKALDRGGPIIYAPFFWRWIMLAIRVTPQVIFNKVNL